MESGNEEVQAGQRVKRTDIFKDHPGNLLHFVQTSTLTGVKDVLDQKKQEQYDLDTALFIAVVENFAQAIVLLLDAGAFINAQTTDGDTALHYAVHYAVEWYDNDPEVIELLLENGANADLQNHDGETPLDNALEYNNHTMIRILRRAVNDSQRYTAQLAEYDLHHEHHRRPRIRARNPVIVQRTASQFGTDATQAAGRFV